MTNTLVKKVELRTQTARRGEGLNDTGVDGGDRGCSVHDGKSPSSLNPHQQPQFTASSGESADELMTGLALDLCECACEISHSR